MAYSYSKLTNYDNCGLRYRFIYIDKAETDFENSIEGFMGSRVHEALEKLYKDLKLGLEPKLSELIKYYRDEWKKKDSDSIKVVRENLSKKEYLKLGEKYISNYYNSHTPFDQDYTIGLEMEVSLDLLNDGKYLIKGYIDRLATKGNKYIIHDYKTSGTLPTNDDINSNKQLALYAIALRDMYPNVEEIELVWHYLAFDKEIRITKSDSDYEKLRIEIKDKIDEIESKTYDDFKPRESTLCDWCEFASKCPLKSHLVKTKQLSLDQYSKDYGVNLTQKYFELQDKKEKIAGEIEAVENEIYSYAQREGVEQVYGTQGTIKIYNDLSYKVPLKGSTKFELLKKIITSKNLNDYMTLDSYNLVKSANTNTLPIDIKSEMLSLLEQKQGKRIYARKKFS